MSTNSMTIEGKTVLVTGANRGIGRALVDEVLSRGASRVYAGTRTPLSRTDGRVVPLTLDVTDRAQIRSAVEQVESLDILVSNAGVSLGGDLDRAVIEQHLAVNLFGSLDVIQTFLPLVIDARPVGATRRECSRGPARPGRHGHDPPPRPAEDLS